VKKTDHVHPGKVFFCLSEKAEPEGGCSKETFCSDIYCFILSEQDSLSVLKAELLLTYIEAISPR
jgi:hypothetical protein